MKTILTIAAAVLVAGTVNAQKLNDKDVPKTVSDAFTKKYPGTKAGKWVKEGADFEVEFELNKIESSAIFDATGTFKEVEQEIQKNELPKGIAEYCTKTFTGYKFDEAAKITDNKGKVTYEAEMAKGKEHFDALFDDKGNFIKKSDIEKGEEKKD